MSNFFGALDSDDDEPVKIASNKKGAAAPAAAKAAAPAAVAPKAAADRLTGADKKNRDQKRHGATPRGPKGEAAPAPEGKKREFDRRSGTGKPGGQSKQGRGKFAFGSPDQEAEQATKDPSSAEIPIDEIAVDDAPVEVAEPEVPTKSMEDFLAERAAKKAAVAALAGAKKERKVEAVAVSGKSVVDELLASTIKTAETAKGPSARKAASVKVDISYGFRSENAYEDRPPREFNADRPPRAPREGGDRPPREDRPPRAPREDGDRPARPPRKEGDNKDRPPRRENRDGARPQNGANANKPRDFQQRSKGPQVNLKDAEAFPAL